MMIKDLKNWTEVTKGLYRYAISTGVCYEIHILLHYTDTDILTAKASLFIAGDRKKDNENFFERERLLSEQSVSECLEKAYEDNEANEVS